MQNQQIIVNNIMVGDVWIVSGQSNIDLPIYRVEDLYKELTDAKKRSTFAESSQQHPGKGRRKTSPIPAGGYWHLKMYPISQHFPIFWPTTFTRRQVSRKG